LPALARAAESPPSGPAVGFPPWVPNHAAIALDTEVIPPDAVADVDRCGEAHFALLGPTTVVLIEVRRMIFRVATRQIAEALALLIPVVVVDVPGADIIHRRDRTAAVVGDADHILVAALARK
jgi:hypothetical protein